MKKKGKVQIALLLCGLLLSCSHEHKNYVDASIVEYSDFEDVEDLKAEIIDLDSFILAPIQLQIYDTILAVMNSRADKLVHLFNLKSKKKVAEHISVGQGPDEMLVPRFVENDGRSVQVSDLMTSIVSKYDSNDFMSQEEPASIEKISLEKRPFGEVRLLNKNFVGPARKVSCLLYRFNERGEVVDSIGSYPKTSWENTDTEKIDMYAFSFATNLQDKVAICYNWTDLIDIYDDKGKLCNRIHGPKCFVSQFKEFNDGKVISTSAVKDQTRDAYFCPVNVGDEFWVLFSGKSESEEGYSILANQIMVYGWDGSPRRILNLNKGIFAFTVDKKNKKVYGISDDPDFHILSFSY
ncbi:BF3164 family lipoprotein [uncultured Bacteroides sp.]|uniref:BF3164 family lipoprotein n=1 Tax=uncultured Bacteroides sp. TaxID=162156 RepID=UPI0025CC2519|nr:BF3164 family lipoprotein [uncultured Bacteroides sp.]